MSKDKRISEAFERAQLLKGRALKEQTASVEPDKTLNNAEIARARALAEGIKRDRAASHAIHSMSASERAERVKDYEDRARLTDDSSIKRALTLAAGVLKRTSSSASDEDRMLQKEIGFDRPAHRRDHGLER